MERVKRSAKQNGKTNLHNNSSMKGVISWLKSIGSLHNECVQPLEKQYRRILQKYKTNSDTRKISWKIDKS